MHSINNSSILQVKAAKEKISELEKAPSESSMSSTVDISAEIAEQLQVCEDT